MKNMRVDGAGVVSVVRQSFTEPIGSLCDCCFLTVFCKFVCKLVLQGLFHVLNLFTWQPIRILTFSASTQAFVISCDAVHYRANRKPMCI